MLEKKEKKKTAQKERNIQLQLEYPEIVSKMAVLMGSGTVSYTHLDVYKRQVLILQEASFLVH